MLKINYNYMCITIYSRNIKASKQSEKVKGARGGILVREM